MSNVPAAEDGSDMNDDTPKRAKTADMLAIELVREYSVEIAPAPYLGVELAAKIRAKLDAINVAYDREKTSRSEALTGQRLWSALESLFESSVLSPWKLLGSEMRARVAAVEASLIEEGWQRASEDESALVKGALDEQARLEGEVAKLRKQLESLTSFMREHGEVVLLAIGGVLLEQRRDRCDGSAAKRAYDALVPLLPELPFEPAPVEGVGGETATRMRAERLQHRDALERRRTRTAPTPDEVRDSRHWQGRHEPNAYERQAQQMKAVFDAAEARFPDTRKELRDLDTRVRRVEDAAGIPPGIPWSKYEKPPQE